MKTLLTTLFLVTLLCDVTHARLGETAEEITGRYAKPIAKQTEGIFGLSASNYLFKGYSITANFKDGKCVREEITPKAKQELTEEECFELAKSVGGMEWAWKKSAEFFWTRDDGAVAIGDKNHFVVESERFAKHRDSYLKEQAEAKQTEAKKKTDGF